MNTCHRYIWYKKQCKVYSVIQYHWNVSVNSQWIYINTNSTLLGSLSSPTVTLREMTSEMICKSAIIADATPGRQQLWKKHYVEYMCVKIFMCTYVKKLTDMSKIDEYIWIHVIDIYDMKNKAK